MRYRANKRRSARHFNRNASRTKAINVGFPLSRGGRRL